MEYPIQFKPRAIKDLKGIASVEVRRMMEKIEALRYNLTGDVKKLTHFTPEYRLRVGDYRILFKVENETVMIYRILHRKDAYS